MTDCLGNVSWREIFDAACTFIEQRYGIEVDVDNDLLDDLRNLAKNSLAGYGLENPNAAKVAGHLCFWVRRVKPVRCLSENGKKYVAVNEEIGLLVGLAVCDRYVDDRRGESFQVSERVLTDWIFSLHRHSQSPHALAMAFEILTSRIVT